MTRNDLRDAARERGLATSGNKTELAERIAEHDKAKVQTNGRRGFMSVSQWDACVILAEAARPLGRAALDGDERPSDRRTKLQEVMEELLRDDHGDAPAVVRELADHLRDLEDNGRPERAEYIRKIALRELNKAVQT